MACCPGKWGFVTTMYLITPIQQQLRGSQSSRLPAKRLARNPLLIEIVLQHIEQGFCSQFGS